MNARETILNSNPAARCRAPLSPPAAPPPAGDAESNVITLAFVTRRLPETDLARRLAGALGSETGEPVLWVRLGSPTPRAALSEWKQRESTLNGEFGFQDRLAPEAAGVARLDFDLAGCELDGALLGPMLAHFRRHFPRVVLHADSGLPARAVSECAVRSDTACLFLNRSAQSLCSIGSLARSVREREGGGAVRLLPVLCLAADEQAHGFKHEFCGQSDAASAVEARRLALEEVHLLRDREDTFGRHVRGLARSLCGRRLGLVLSSGGARGLAHIGVIQVFEENGIEIDAVAGCSMGAYIAAVWAYGLDGGTMEALAREIETRWGLWKLIDPALPPRHGFITGEAVIRRLKRTIGAAHFSDLVRPLRIVATNLATLERTVFASGEVAAAVHASSAIPGICVPVTLQGETYVDGGVTEPLPVDVLREMGIEHVIASNTIPTPAYLQCCRELEREQAALRRRRPSLLRRLGSQVNYFARGNILDIMMKAVHGAQIRVAEQACLRADVVMRPLACDARWHDFTHPGKYIALGRQVAAEHLKEIQSLRKGAVHERDTTQDRMAIAV